MLKRLLLCFALLVAPALALAQAPPPVPVIPDANRYESFSPVSSTSVFDVSFPVFGSCEDLTVQLNGTPLTYSTQWTCASASGNPLASLPLPITDMQVTLTTPISSGFLEIIGDWQPRRTSQPTNPGINRYEFNESLSSIIAGMRELHQQELPQYPQTAGFIPIAPGSGGQPIWGPVPPVAPSTAPANEFANGVGAGGLMLYAQPSFTNLSGLAACAQLPALTGDATSSGCATTLATVNSGAGPVGSSTTIPVLTTNAKGLVTAQTTAAVVAPASTLTGTLLAATMPAMTGDCTSSAGTVSLSCLKTGGVAFGSLATLNAAPAGTLTGIALASGVVNSSLTSVGALTAGSLATGFTPVANALLANDATTVNGQSCVLGSTCAIAAVTSVSVVSGNGFAGTVATPTTTPAITLTTSITGLLKGNGTAISAAVAGTDYLTPTGNGSGLTGLAYTQLPAIVANQLLGALTATTPSGLSVPSCSATNDALNWTSGTGFACQTMSGGTVTSVAASVPAGLAVSGSPITGAGTLAFSWSGTIPASSIPGTLGPILSVNGSPPTFELRNVGAGVDQNNWDVIPVGNTLRFRTVNDAYSAANTWMSISRTGYVPTGFSFYEPVLANVLGAIYPMAPPYNCVGNGSTDDTACITSALAAAANGRIYWGPHLYAISTELTPSSPFTAVGTVAAWGSCESGLEALTANMNLISAPAGTSFEHTCLEMNTGSVNTSGAALTISNVNQVKFKDGVIDGACIGVDLSGNSDEIADTYISNDGGGSNCYGVRIGALTDQAHTIDPRIVNTTIQGNQANAPYANQYILDAGGLYESNNDMLYGNYGTLIAPGCISSTGQQVNTPFFSNTVLGDTTPSSGLTINATCSAAWVMGVNIMGGWAASNTAGDLVLIENTSAGTVDGVNFVGTRLVNVANGNWGIYAGAGKNISFTSGFICGYGATGSGGGGGIYVSTTLGHVKANDNTIGRTCLNQTTSATGTYTGLEEAGTVPDVMAVGNDLTDNTTEISGTWTVNANNM